MGYFQVRYDSRVMNYDRRGFIILATAEVGQVKTYLEKTTMSSVPCFCFCCQVLRGYCHSGKSRPASKWWRPNLLGRS